jgi:Domain of unknown function (DUF5666)
MRRFALLAALLLAAAGVRAACEPGGMGGTGIRSDGGIGGTGIQAQGDLGLIGVITAFGSICVNGVEVHYEPSTPVTVDGAASSPSALALGQVVAVRVATDGAQARARDIQVLDAVIGRVDAFDPAANALQVAGQRVRLDSATVLAAAGAAGELAGETVRVSGLWRADGSLAATRIDRAPADATARVGSRDWPDLGTRRLIVEGYVAELGADMLRVGGTVFSAPPRVLAGLERDRLVRLSGHVERDGSRIAERIDLERLERSGPERGGREGERGERGERLERSDNRGPGRPDRPDRIERPDRGERIERPERPDRSGPH